MTRLGPNTPHSGRSHEARAAHRRDVSGAAAPPALRSNAQGHRPDRRRRRASEPSTVADHVWQHPIHGRPHQEPGSRPTPTLGFIAAHTRRVRLLALATAAPYRPAGLLAKQVTTLDVLSGGRMMLGIGAGDYQEEAEGLCLPYPPCGSGSRSSRRRSSSASGCGRASTATRAVQGQHVRLGRALNVPQSLSRPHPPILIAARASSEPCRWSPATRTPATSSRRPRSAPARPPPPPVRRGRPRLRRDREDGAVGLRRGRGRLEGRRGRRTRSGGCRPGDPNGLRVGRRRRPIRPIEVMAREVIPAVADLCSRYADVALRPGRRSTTRQLRGRLRVG